MTNDSLDWMIRQALLAAAEADCQQVMAQTTEELSPSPAYQRWTQHFLKNPLAELRRTRRPVWQNVARTAACFLLAGSLSFATVMAVSPSAREQVVRWFTYHFSDHVSYTFSGQDSSDALRNWVPTYLPDGYVQTDFIDLENQIAIYYNADDPDMRLKFNYMLLSEGGGFDLDNEHHTISNVTINGLSGQLLTATDNVPNMLVWFDEVNNYAFLLMSRLNCDTLIRIAENVKPVE